jgi:mRNA interferase MazF
MDKDFNKWSLLKIHLNKRSIRDERGYIRIGCYPREIWMCSVGINIGSEEDGKNERYSRPVLVLKVFNPDMFWGIPLTSKRHESKFYQPIVWNCKTSWAILSQLRIFSPKRLDEKRNPPCGGNLGGRSPSNSSIPRVGKLSTIFLMCNCYTDNFICTSLF